MLELLGRLRDVVIAFALAWIGVTVSADTQRKPPRDQVVAAHANTDCKAPKPLATDDSVRCLDSSGCPSR